MTDKDYLFNAKERVKLAIITDRGDENALAVATIANAEASIAVAEELRTANLIAYIEQATVALDGDDPSEAAVTWLTEETRKVRVRLGMSA